MDERAIAGRYELRGRLGVGGMAEIWRATDRTLGRQVAVKILHANLAHDTAFVERFRREARHAAALAHENVVAVYDTGTGTDGRPFIVMELVDGQTLSALLRENGPLPVQQTVRIGRQILAGLRHAHERGLVHRDVKPANILLPREGGVKVADFGIARGSEATQALTQVGTVLGTASYISPEQASGHSATAASDVYGVGCLLYECLIGRPPFTADSPVAVALAHQREPVVAPSTLRADVPQALDAVVLTALAKAPPDRYASADAMERALAATGLDRQPDTQPTAVMPAPVPAATVPIAAARPAAGGTQVLPGRPPSRPSRLARTFGLVGIALLVGALAWLVAAYVSLREPAPVETPEPTPTVEVTPLPTPVPTPLPTPDEPTPEPTEEPEPTPEPTPDPTPTQEPTPTPTLPVVIPTPTPTPTPTATPTPQFP